MFRFIRYLVGTLLLLVVVGFVLRWAMGDNFRPWVRLVKQTAADKMAKLVNEYQLALDKSKLEVERTKERAATLRLQKHQESVAVKSLEREMKMSQQEISDAKTQLATLEGQLSQHHPVRLVSGRVASPAEMQGFVSDFGNRIQIAQEKIGYLEQLLTRRNIRYQKLTELAEQSPAAIQRLQNSVDYLGQKVALYREVEQWIEAESAAESEMAGIYEKAQQTLEDAHLKLDGKLAEMDAILDASLQLDMVQPKEPASTDGVLADIRSILNQKYVVAEK